MPTLFIAFSCSLSREYLFIVVSTLPHTSLQVTLDCSFVFVSCCLIRHLAQLCPTASCKLAILVYKYDFCNKLVCFLLYTYYFVQEQNQLLTIVLTIFPTNLEAIVWVLCYEGLFWETNAKNVRRKKVFVWQKSEKCVTASSAACYYFCTNMISVLRNLTLVFSLERILVHASLLSLCTNMASATNIHLVKCFHYFVDAVK